MDTFLAALAALTPPIGVGLLFYLAIRALMNADRNERTALARMEAEEDARRAPGTSTAAASGGSTSSSSGFATGASTVHDNGAV